MITRVGTRLYDFDAGLTTELNRLYDESMMSISDSQWTMDYIKEHGYAMGKEDEAPLTVRPPEHMDYITKTLAHNQALKSLWNDRITADDMIAKATRQREDTIERIQQLYINTIRELADHAMDYSAASMKFWLQSFDLDAIEYLAFHILDTDKQRFDLSLILQRQHIYWGQKHFTEIGMWPQTKQLVLSLRMTELDGAYEIANFISILLQNAIIPQSVTKQLIHCGWGWDKHPTQYYLNIKQSPYTLLRVTQGQFDAAIEEGQYDTIREALLQRPSFEPLTRSRA